MAPVHSRAIYGACEAAGRSLRAQEADGGGGHEWGWHAARGMQPGAWDRTQADRRPDIGLSYQSGVKIFKICMHAKHPCTLAYASTIDVIDLAVGIIINTIWHYMQR